MGRKKYTFNLKNSRIIKNLDDYTGNEFPVLEKIIKYSINIIKSNCLSDSFFDFLLNLLDFNTRKKLINYIYEGSIRKKNHHPNNYYSNMEHIYDLYNISSNIVTDIYDNKLKLKEDNVRKIILSLLNEIKEYASHINKDKYYDRTIELKKIFNLDDEDISILEFLYCTYNYPNKWLEALQNSLSFNEFLRLISTAIEIPYIKVKKILGKQNRLHASSIIDNIDTINSNYFSIDNTISEYLAGISETSLVDNYLKADAGTVFPVNSFNIDNTKIDIIKSLLSSSRPVNIFLYGVSGCGKTEFARSIAASSGKQVYFLNYGELDYFNNRNSKYTNYKILTLKFVEKNVQADKGIIIADEADNFLNTSMHYVSSLEPMEKGSLNNFLDRFNTQIIWISNRTCYMEESTLRRFDFSLYFDGLTFRKRENIWQNLLKDHPLKECISQDTISRLSKQYQVNSGGIASALRVVTQCIEKNSATSEKVEEILNECLKQHERLINEGIETHKKKMHDISDKYDVSVLNTDVQPGFILSSFKGFLERKLSTGKTNDFNINVIFYGIAGSGKTEFAKYLAKESGLELVLKRSSDLESMFVGETEHNIEQAFREAEENNSILFIDEADSFFTSRENAYRSWEVSRTNELLTQMENHRGIFICCTNLLHTMDSAAMRRFHFKVKFNSLKDEAKAVIYSRYFNMQSDEHSSICLERLRAIPDLTPGDIKSVYERMKFLPEEELCHEKIISELEKEAGFKHVEKTARVGF